MPKIYMRHKLLKDTPQKKAWTIYWTHTWINKFWLDPYDKELFENVYPKRKTRSDKWKIKKCILDK